VSGRIPITRRGYSGPSSFRHGVCWPHPVVRAVPTHTPGALGRPGRARLCRGWGARLELAGRRGANEATRQARTSNLPMDSHGPVPTSPVNSGKEQPARPSRRARHCLTNTSTAQRPVCARSCAVSCSRPTCTRCPSGTPSPLPGRSCSKTSADGPGSSTARRWRAGDLSTG
jgi:hypothetical protein